MVRFVGIALTEQEAALRPKSSISTDIQSISSLSAGKLFVGIEGGEDEKFALKMEFDGNSVKIKSHETAMGSTLENVTSGRYKPYAIDLPMRFVTVQETPHEIFFITGTYDSSGFRETSRQGPFYLLITSEAPVIDEKVSPADSD